MPSSHGAPRPAVLAVVLALTGAAPAAAQTSPFLGDPAFGILVDEVSGDRAFESIRHLSHFHRTSGSRDFWAATEWIRGAAVAAGLEDVHIVRQKWDGHSWSCLSGEASLLEPQGLKLADYTAVPVSIADQSRTTHVTAEIVDVGEGIADKDYAGREIKGRIVLASGSLGTVHREAVWKRGALGVLSHATNRPDAVDAPDQVAWGRLPYESKRADGVAEKLPSTFAVMISPRRGRWLQKQMAAGTRPFKLKVDIEAAYPSREEQAYVEAWIRGSEVHDQQIVLTAHIQEEKSSANDDGSGCASMLETGRALTRLIKEGRLPRPRRDIRFWWVNELDSEKQFFRENPAEARRMLVDVNQDMVGARQSLGGRVQYASRMPWSLPHALEDVVESVMTAVRDGNTSLLIHRGTGKPQPFPREIVALRGTREPYQARVIPYYDSTDHHAFTPGRIGVPGTSLTNWPDEFIHSSADDLDQVDATQLRRNAVVVAATAWVLAAAGEDEAVRLAVLVGARGRARLATDLAAGLAFVAESPAGERAAAAQAARNLVRQSARKERGALASVGRLRPQVRVAEATARGLSALESAEAASLASLEAAVATIAGHPLDAPEPTPEERQLAARVYVPVPDLGAYLDAIGELRPPGDLHAMMAFEAYNFCDGTRNALEVYEAVDAEALSAGHWYYGRVKPADVLAALDQAVQAGAFTVTTVR